LKCALSQVPTAVVCIGLALRSKLKLHLSLNYFSRTKSKNILSLFLSKNYLHVQNHPVKFPHAPKTPLAGVTVNKGAFTRPPALPIVLSNTRGLILGQPDKLVKFGDFSS